MEGFIHNLNTMQQNYNFGQNVQLLCYTARKGYSIGEVEKKGEQVVKKAHLIHPDDVIFYSLEAPVKFAIILLGIWIAIHRLVYPDSFVKVVDNAYSILIVLDITWFFGRLFSSLLQVYWGKQSNGQANKMMPIIKRTILVIVWLIGIVMALSNVGVNISALLGTLGIGGIAFALAAQDTVKNVFGTFTILTDKPFSIGDTIRVDSYEGRIDIAER